jgi:hypothetical protein
MRNPNTQKSARIERGDHRLLGVGAHCRQSSATGKSGHSGIYLSVAAGFDAGLGGFPKGLRANVFLRLRNDHFRVATSTACVMDGPLERGSPQLAHRLNADA